MSDKGEEFSEDLARLNIRFSLDDKDCNILELIIKLNKRIEELESRL